MKKIFTFVLLLIGSMQGAEKKSKSPFFQFSPSLPSITVSCVEPNYYEFDHRKGFDINTDKRKFISAWDLSFEKKIATWGEILEMLKAKKVIMESTCYDPEVLQEKLSRSKVYLKEPGTRETYKFETRYATQRVTCSKEGEFKLKEGSISEDDWAKITAGTVGAQGNVIICLPPL